MKRVLQQRKKWQECVIFGGIPTMLAFFSITNSGFDILPPLNIKPGMSEEQIQQQKDEILSLSHGVSAGKTSVA